MPSTTPLILLAACCLLLHSSSASKLHLVGGSYGWKTPATVSFYDDWARSQSFVVGDKLVFPFTTGMENVMEVSKEDVENCTMKVVKNMFHTGPVVVTLTKPGWYYYFSGIGLHCEGGAKLSIHVASATTQPDLQ